MPLLALQTSTPLSNQQRHELLAPLSQIVAECIGKPERYVMITIDQTTMLMLMGGGRRAGGLCCDPQHRWPER